MEAIVATAVATTVAAAVAAATATWRALGNHARGEEWVFLRRSIGAGRACDAIDIWAGFLHGE